MTAKEALAVLIEDIRDESTEEPNPHHILDILTAENREWRSKNRGTSFVLFPCTTSFVQNSPREEGKKVREEILSTLCNRLSLLLLRTSIPHVNLRSGFCPQGIVGFNNGEIYLWLHNCNLPDDVACNIMMELRKSLLDDPIRVTFLHKEYEVPFYGVGFRQL